MVKFFRYLSVSIFITIIISSCSEESEENSASHLQLISVEYPKVLSTRFNLPSDIILSAVLRVDDNQQQVLDNNNLDTPTLAMTLMTGVEYRFELTVFATKTGNFADLKIAQSITNAFVSENTNTVMISTLSTEFDSDSDGYTNLKEIQTNTNPLVREEYVRFEKSFIVNNVAGGDKWDYAEAVSATDNGGWIVAGRSYNNNLSNGFNGNYDLVVLKYLSDGSLDTQFNDDGIFVYDSDPNQDLFETAYCIHKNDNGWIVGGALPGMLAIQISDNGQLISTFADNGISANGIDCSVGSNKTIRLVGNTSAADMAMWQLTATGELDTAFNSSGLFTHNNAAGGNGYDIARSFIEISGGWIVAGSSINVNGKYDMALWKLSANGNLDNNFGTNGVYTYDRGNGDDRAYGITYTSDGGWVVVGQTSNASNFWEMTIWKFSAAGVLDTSYANNGVYTYQISNDGSGNSAAFDIAIANDGGWVVVGQRQAKNTYSSAAVWKFTKQGLLDTSFDEDGIYGSPGVTNTAAISSARAVTITSDGSWVVVGEYAETQVFNDIAIWKFR